MYVGAMWPPESGPRPQNSSECQILGQAPEFLRMPDPGYSVLINCTDTSVPVLVHWYTVLVH